MKEHERLTLELAEQTPGFCRRCANPAGELWVEHDANDQPEPKYVWLCKRCSDEIVDPHPRLYHSISPNTPAPGAMRLCADCRFRDGGTCHNPDAGFNGGKGLNITCCKPIVAHIDGRDSSGKRRSWWMRIYDKPPSACSGHTPKE